VSAERLNLDLEGRRASTLVASWDLARPVGEARELAHADLDVLQVPLLEVLPHPVQRMPTDVLTTLDVGIAASDASAARAAREPKECHDDERRYDQEAPNVTCTKEGEA